MRGDEPRVVAELFEIENGGRIRLARRVRVGGDGDRRGHRVAGFLGGHFGNARRPSLGVREKALSPTGQR